MGEAAVMAAALDAELAKLIKDLPKDGSAGSLENAVAVSYHRTCQKLSQTLQHYSSKLQLYTYIPKLLQLGEQLQRKGHHALAREACYSPVVARQLPALNEVFKFPPTDRLASHIQAMFGSAVCQAQMITAADPHCKLPASLQGIGDSLRQLKEALALTIPHDQLHWLVFNGTVHVYAVAEPLMAAGFSNAALPHLVYAAKALESQIMLSAPELLPWRTRVYTTACVCYSELRCSEQAELFLQHGLQQIEGLFKLQLLDPVPPPPATLAAYAAARAQLQSLKLRFSGADSASTLDAVVKDSSLMELERLGALLQALLQPGERVLQCKAATADQRKLLEAAAAIALPLLKRVTESVLAEADATAAGADAAADTLQAAGSSATAAADALPCHLHQALLCAAYHFEQQQLMEQLVAAAGARASQTGVSAADGADSLHGVVQLLAAFGKGSEGEGASRNRAAVLLQHAEAAAATQPDLVTDAALLLRTTTRDKLDAAPHVVAQSDSNSSAGGEAADVDEVLNLLLALHGAFQTVDLDDAVLRCSTAVRLAAMQEERQQLPAAQCVLQQALVVAQRARCELLLLKQTGEDAAVRWISASRTQCKDGRATLMSGLGDVEQDLGCLHADMLAQSYRVELKLGVQQLHAQADTRKNRLQETISRRDAQATIYGPRTQLQKRHDEGEIDKLGKAPGRAALRERELLQRCGKNVYERALCLMQAAAFPSEQHRQAAMLQEAAEQLRAAEAQEEAQFAVAVARGSSSRTEVPAAPKVLCRTSTALTVIHPDLNLKSNKKPASYAVYCKSFGAGIGLSITSTSMELPGTGVQSPLGTPVTIEGLQSSDTYLVAVAVYDAQGHLINGIGSSTPELLAALPLPLYFCWAHLMLMACKLGQWAVAQTASKVLLPRFIVTKPSRPLWEANPMDAQVLQRQQLELAAPALVRAFAQAVYAYMDRPSSLPRQLGAHPAPDCPLKTPYIEEQVQRLVLTRTLTMAMSAAGAVEDEMLVQEGAARCSNMLAPLLAARDKPYQLHKALASVHLALKACRNMDTAVMQGQEEQRQLGARLAAATAFHLVGVSHAHGEAAAADYFAKLDMELLRSYDPSLAGAEATPPGAAAVPAADAAAARPASKVGKRAAAAAGAAPPGSSISRGKSDHPTPVLEEVATVQAALLMNPLVDAAAIPALSERLKAPTDLAAQILPKLTAATANAAAASSTDPFDACWPLLLDERARLQPCWAEMVARTMECSVRLGRRTGLQEAADVLSWQARQAFACPVLSFDRWSLSQAAEAIPAAQLDMTALPPRPDVSSLPEEQRQPAMDAWEKEVQRGQQQLQCRTAAASLLQQRLPAMLARRRAVMRCRELRAAWLPWLARANLALGLVAASAAKQSVDTDMGPPRGSSAEPGDTRPGTPAQSVSAPPSHSLTALMRLSRAMTLAARAGPSGWHETLHAARQLWNCARRLLGTDESLTAPAAACTWQLGLPPPPAAPPAALGSGGARMTEKKGSIPAASTAKPADGKPKGKGKQDDKPAEPKQIWLASVAERNAGTAIRCACNALMLMVQGLKQGASLHVGAVPLCGGRPSSSSGSKTGGGSKGAAADRPTTSASAPAASEFSFGSDAVVEVWYAQHQIDMPWMTRVVTLGLTALKKMERWNAVMAVGQWWSELTDGTFNEAVLPFMLEAAPRVGANIAPLQLAMDAVVRDKKQGIEQLERVRGMVRDRLADPPLFGHQGAGGTHAKKKSSRQVPAGSDARSSSNPNSARLGPLSPGRDGSSVVSGWTFRTGLTGKTKASQPDHLRLPGEYEKVIEVLKKRGEKQLMILATNELGDVHAHFGNWAAASASWHTALDTILGPFQVLKCWRKALGGLSPPQLLTTIGVRNLLLAGGVLLGKLARYSCYSDAGARLQCARLGATLLAGVFAGGLEHPQRPLDFALYTPVELWQGTDVFNDPYWCSVPDLSSGLETVTRILLANDLPLEALPVISLWEHVSYRILRSAQATVLCRLSRARALCRLGQLAQAAAVLSGLLRGSRLPDDTFESNILVKDVAPVKDAKAAAAAQKAPAVTATAVFDNRLPAGHPDNAACIAYLADAPLPEQLTRMYGPWLAGHLKLARAEFLAAAGAVPHSWRAQPSAPGSSRPGSAASGAGAPAVSTQVADVSGPLLEKAAKLLTAATETARAALRPATAAADAPKPAVAGKSRADRVKQLDAGKSSKVLAAGSGNTSPLASARGGSPPKSPRLGAPKSPRAGAKQAAKETAPASDASNPASLEYAQYMEILSAGLLQLADVDLLRWSPITAWGHAKEAMTLLATLADCPALTAGSSDDAERVACTSVTWLRCRLKLADIALQLRHYSLCLTHVTKGLAEAATVKEQLLALDLLQLQAHADAALGNTPAALNTYGHVAAGYQKQCAVGGRLGPVLLRHALLREELGLRADAARLAQQALQVLQEQMNDLGVKEMREWPERVNLHTRNLSLCAEATLYSATTAVRQGQLAAARAAAAEAQALLQLSTGHPLQHARTAMAVGRLARCEAMLDADENGTGNVNAADATAPTADLALQQQATRLAAARDNLKRALLLGATDGGCHHAIIRSCLLELACMAVASHDPNQAAACLKAAHATASKLRTLLFSSRTLQPVTRASLPPWLVALLTAQEQHAAVAAGLPVPESMPDADLGRLAVCYYANLVKNEMRAVAPTAAAATQQLLQLHPALQAACAKYNSDCCFAEPPLPPAPGAAPSVTAGTVLLSWYLQDGTWQQQNPWHTECALPQDSVTQQDLEAVAHLRHPRFVTLLYVVGVPNATAAAAATAAPPPTTAAQKQQLQQEQPAAEVVCGEVTVPFKAVRQLLFAVKDIAFRLESPKGATDLFGFAAPSVDELRRVWTDVQHVLTGYSPDNDAGAPSAPPAGSSSSSSSTAAAADQTGGTSGQDTQQAAASTDAGQAAATPAAAAEPAAAAKAAPLTPEPENLVDSGFPEFARAPETWAKLEALLDPEDGLHVQDPVLALWLSGVLKQRQT